MHPTEAAISQIVRTHSTTLRKKKNIELKPSPKIILVKRKELNTVPTMLGAHPYCVCMCVSANCIRLCVCECPRNERLTAEHGGKKVLSEIK